GKSSKPDRLEAYPTAPPRMTDVVDASIYDFPQYYDLLFGSDWRAEFDFLRTCFEKHARLRRRRTLRATPPGPPLRRGGAVRRVFEPACGTGRLLIKLAQAGYDVAGNDLNPKAVAFCNQRLQRHGFRGTTFVGDMADFRVAKKFDAAFNMINSFR